MLDFILLIMIVVLLLPVLILCLQVIAAIALPEKSLTLNTKLAPRIAILMPAHNEALVIQATIQSVLPQLTADDCLLVVADNCTDTTAQIAKQLGAQVVERHDLNRRGKGYALDFGLQYLRAAPPEVVIIIDADCLVEPDTIITLAKACVQYQRPMQALYLMESQPNPSIKARVASFAWLVKNKVRPLGARRLGLPCQLMGTGMAFLWADITQVDLANGHIVEDMKLGAALARLHKAPLFVPQACVTSVFPPTEAATQTQRARWEHGHLSLILSEVPSLIWQSIKTANIQLLGLACDLLVPPLAVLALLCVAVNVVAVLWASPIISQLAGLMLGLFALAVLLAWLFFGRAVISFKQLCYAPLYVLAKIPLYIKFFFNRQVEWVRSKRD